jgi:predicted esterase
MFKYILVFLTFVFASNSFAYEYEIDLHLKDLSLGKYEYTSQVSENQRVVLSYGGVERSYFIYFPKNIEEKMPVLVALHGAGRSGSSMIDMWSKNAERHSFVVIAPNGNGNSWNTGIDECGFIYETIKHALSKRRVTYNEIFLFGHSAGAMQAITLAAEHPDKFKSVVAHAGTVPFPIRASGSNLSGSNIRIALFLGDRDHIFSIASARKTVDWLSSLGLSPTLYILKNHSHWYYDDADRINESAWEFLSER